MLQRAVVLHLEDVVLGGVAVGAPVVLHRLDRIIELVDPLGGERRVGVGAGDDAAADLKAHGVLAGDGLFAVGVLQRGQGHVVVGGAGAGVVPRHEQAVAVAGRLGDVGVVVLGEDFGVDEALGVEGVQPFETGDDALVRQGVDHLFVVGDHIVVGVVAVAEGAEQHAHVLIAAVHDEGERQAVGMGLLEGAQHLGELVGGGGHIQAQLIQPGFVDPGNAADGLDGFLAAAQLLDPGEGVDVAVGGGDEGAVLGIFVQHLLQVGHVLVDEVIHRDDGAVLGVAQQVVLAHLGVKDHVGQFLLGQGQLLFLAELVVHVDRPVDVDVGGFLQPLGDQTVVDLLPGEGGLMGQRREGDGLAQGEGGRGRIHRRGGAVLARTAAGQGAQRQGGGAGQGQRPFGNGFHTVSPFLLRIAV